MERFPSANKKQRTNAKKSHAYFPDDNLVSIFLFCQVGTLNSCFRVCKSWYKVANIGLVYERGYPERNDRAESFWKKYYTSLFKVVKPSDKPQNWKLLFVDRYTTIKRLYSVNFVKPLEAVVPFSKNLTGSINELVKAQGHIDKTLKQLEMLQSLQNAIKMNAKLEKFTKGLIFSERIILSSCKCETKSYDYWDHWNFNVVFRIYGNDGIPYELKYTKHNDIPDKNYVKLEFGGLTLINDGMTNDGMMIGSGMFISDLPHEMITPEIMKEFYSALLEFADKSFCEIFL